MTPKGFPLDGDEVGWRVFDSGVPYPVAVLRRSALEHNGATMREYCERHGVSLAPHGKTTMAPAIFNRQISDGAWAITAATVWQAAAMRDAGVGRILIANQVVGPAEAMWLADAQEEAPVYCYVDSIDGVEILAGVLDRMEAERPIPVLLERGVDGGRTGVRSTSEGLAVAEAVHASPHLVLSGTAGFEGIITGTDDRPAGDRVDEFLDSIVELTHAVAARELFQPSPEVIVTAGGSAFFDHVVDRFSAVDIDLPRRIVIRSGCYITHDDGSYDRSSPMGQNPRIDGDGRLMAAIEVWGVVLSRPEPGRALVGIGKRDVSPDRVLPLVKKVRRRKGGPVEEVDPVPVVALNDQHAYLDLDPADPLAVGDLVGMGISHPCTTFDKWRALAVVDDDYRVTEVAGTIF